ncbi:MAG TPA: hypothetical protein VHG09_08960 [Longimicrobiales bacterium]|nr:hypothetical protein [Longimicrobiales bacterium]
MASARRTIVALSALSLALPLSGTSASAQAPKDAVPIPVERLGKPSTPPDDRGRRILAAADKAAGTKILVSTEDRWLACIRPRYAPVRPRRDRHGQGFRV